MRAKAPLPALPCHFPSGCLLFALLICHGLRVVTGNLQLHDEVLLTLYVREESKFEGWTGFTRFIKRRGGERLGLTILASVVELTQSLPLPVLISANPVQISLRLASV